MLDQRKFLLSCHELR